MCRCSETAKITFGEYVTDPELRQKPPEDTQGQDSFQAKAIELLRMYRGRIPIAFVNHRPNIDSLTMELMGIGELLAGTVTDDVEIEILGKIEIKP